jgi:TonB family protein
MRDVAQFFSRFPVLRTGLCFLVLLTGGLPATSAGTADDERMVNPELLWPLSINMPMDIAHLIHPQHEARVILRIDPEGKVVDWVALSLPHYRLFDPLDRALREALFTPATIDGEAVMLDTSVTIPIGEAGYYGVLVMTPATYIEGRIDQIAGGLNGMGLCGPGGLDKPLKLLSEGNPVAFLDEDGTPVKGSVDVDFYIDQDGVPRIVRPDQGANAFLQEAAMRTVQQFRFIPPRQGGRRVIVHATMQVRF